MWGWLWKAGRVKKPHGASTDAIRLHIELHEQMMRDEYDFTKATPFHHGTGDLYRRRRRTMFPECAKCGIIGTERSLIRHGNDSDWTCKDLDMCAERRILKIENQRRREVVCARLGCRNPVANYCPEHDGRTSQTIPEWYGRADGSFTIYPGRSPGCGRCGMQHLNCSR